MDRRLRDALAARAGIALRAELSRAGVDRREIADALASGALIRLRHGVFAHHRVDRQVQRAVRVGGVLAGHSAAGILGLWRIPAGSARDLVVSVPPHSAGLRHPDDPRKTLDPHRDGVRLLYDGVPLRRLDKRDTVDVTTCVAQIVCHHRPEYGLAVLDSALRLPPRRRPLLADVRSRLPVRCLAIVDAADARAESGTESVLRWRLMRAGVRFSIQEWLTESIRVDFLLEGFLVVECTSFEYHASPRQYESDRDRIADVVRLGYVVLEFTYHQVLFQWDLVWATITTALARHN